MFDKCTGNNTNSRPDSIFVHKEPVNGKKKAASRWNAAFFKYYVSKITSRSSS